MAYDPLLASEVDADSPLTDTLFGKIKGNFEFLKSKTDGIPSLATSGLKPVLGIDTNHDISVAIGAARDTADTLTMVLAAIHVKQLDFRWASGTNAGGLANAALITNNVTVSFDNASSEIRGTGLFSGAGGGDTIIVVGSPANPGNHEITSATANAAVLSIAPTTEAAGASVTVYIIKANWQYDIFIVDNGAGTGVAEIGFDDSLTAANFVALTGAGPEFRCIGYFTTDATANIDEIVWIGDRFRTRLETATRTWRKTAMLRSGDLEGVGAGGGGGFENAASTKAGGGGGGTWGRRVNIPAATFGATEALTVGAPGVGGTTGAQNGTAGGTTSVGSLLSLPGGGGGAIADSGGSGGGVATGADLSCKGQAGRKGGAVSLAGILGAGGDSILGLGPSDPTYSGTKVGEDGFGYGSGGEGGLDLGANANGGDGAPGLIIFTEYYS